jgi:hypothetical protein
MINGRISRRQRYVLRRTVTRGKSAKELDNSSNLIPQTWLGMLPGLGWVLCRGYEAMDTGKLDDSNTSVGKLVG